MSLLEGVNRLIDPHGPESPYWSYGCWPFPRRWALFAQRGLPPVARSQPGKGLSEAIKSQQGPSRFQRIPGRYRRPARRGLAFAGILAATLDSPYPDAVTTILIGLVLAAVAAVLANESRHLLVGDSADEEIVRDIRSLAESDPTVELAPRPFTMQLGPDEVLLALDVRFHDDLSVADVRKAVDRMERAIQRKHPEVKRIYLEVNALDGERSPEVAASSS